MLRSATNQSAGADFMFHHSGVWYTGRENKHSPEVSSVLQCVISNNLYKKTKNYNQTKKQEKKETKVAPLPYNQSTQFIPKA